MKLVVVLAGLLAFWTVGGAQPDEPPVRIRVVPIKDAFDPWDPVILYVEAENVSDVPHAIDRWHPWDIQVLQSDGEEVPWTRYGEKHKHPNFEGGMAAGFREVRWNPALLQPGEVESFMIQLDRWVDLSLPGTYTVRLRRWVVPGGTTEHPLGKARIVSSDQVEFRIKETSWLEMRKFEISPEVRQKENLPADFGTRRPSDGPR